MCHYELRDIFSFKLILDCGFNRLRGLMDSVELVAMELGFLWFLVLMGTVLMPSCDFFALQSSVVITFIIRFFLVSTFWGVFS